MAQIRAADEIQRQALASAIDHLKAAREQARCADAPKTEARIAAAIRSAEGAGRHMAHRLRRSAIGGRPAP